jgi:hypothetical protein
VALLRSLRAHQHADRLMLGAGYPNTGLVLVDALGEPVRPELYSDRFRKLCREAGLREIHLHLVRHTLAGELIRAGATIVDAAALLGHTPDVFVKTYLRPSEAGLRSAASALGVALAGGSWMILKRWPFHCLCRNNRTWSSLGRPCSGWRRGVNAPLAGQANVIDQLGEKSIIRYSVAGVLRVARQVS